MIFDELLKGQLLTNDCNNYLIATNTGEIIESCYRCLHRREKKALELYKKDISIINTKIIDNNFERTLCIIVIYKQYSNNSKYCFYFHKKGSGLHFPFNILNYLYLI